MTHVEYVCKNFRPKIEGPCLALIFARVVLKNFFRASLPVAEVAIPYSIFHDVDP